MQVCHSFFQFICVNIILFLWGHLPSLSLKVFLPPFLWIWSTFPLRSNCRKNNYSVKNKYRCLLMFSFSSDRKIEKNKRLEMALSKIIYYFSSLMIPWIFLTQVCVEDFKHFLFCDLIICPWSDIFFTLSNTFDNFMHYTFYCDHVYPPFSSYPSSTLIISFILATYTPHLHDLLLFL